jgi:hypothetical protein
MHLTNEMLVTVTLNEQDLLTIIICCLQGSASIFLEQRLIESPSVFSADLPVKKMFLSTSKVKL